MKKKNLMMVLGGAGMLFGGTAFAADIGNKIVFINNTPKDMAIKIGSYSQTHPSIRDVTLRGNGGRVAAINYDRDYSGKRMGRPGAWLFETRGAPATASGMLDVKKGGEVVCKGGLTKNIGTQGPYVSAKYNFDVRRGIENGNNVCYFTISLNSA